jgi:phage-related protein
MAGKPTVTLTLAGDEAKLTDAFDKVGLASKRMADQVDSSSSSMTDSAAKFDAMAETTDTAETRFTGFADTIGGVTEGLSAWNDESLSTTEKLQALGQAGADLAGGLTGFVVPAIQSMWTKLMATTAATTAVTVAKGAWAAVTGTVTAAMGALNAVMRANPIMTVITIVGLLVGAFILLWNKSEGFRNFFIGAWDAIKGAVGGAIDWIKGAWNGMLTFFSNLVTSIGNIFSGIGNAISGAFKTGVNFVIDILNVLIGAANKVIYGINLINPFDDIPNIPKIPRMHTGGVVPGMPGQERLMMLQAGERVSTSSQGGGGVLHVSAEADGLFFRMLQEAERIGALTWRGA